MRKPRGMRYGRASAHDRPVDDGSLHLLELIEQRHRTDNLLQTILGLMNLEARRAVQAETQERLHDLSLRIELLVSLQRRLSAVGSGGHVDAGLLIRDSVAAVIKSDKGAIALELEVGALPLDAKRAQSLALLVHEAVTNVARHAFPEGESGRVVVRACQTAAGGMFAEVADNGRGMDPASASNGIGLRLVRTLALCLGGEVHFEDGAPGLKLTLLVPPPEPRALGGADQPVGTASGPTHQCMAVA